MSDYGRRKDEQRERPLSIAEARRRAAERQAETERLVARGKKAPKAEVRAPESGGLVASVKGLFNRSAKEIEDAEGQ